MGENKILHTIGFVYWVTKILSILASLQGSVQKKFE